MFGAIIGDIAGSNLEVNEIVAKKSGQKVSAEQRRRVLSPSFELLQNDCCITDDSILTIAVADCLLHDCNFEKYLREYGNKENQLGMDKWGRSRFGSGFLRWLSGDNSHPSTGNGASMRVSSVGWFCKTLSETLEIAKKSAECSHNTIEAICGAQAVAGSIYLARKGKTKAEIKEFAEKTFGFGLGFNLQKLQEDNQFFATTFQSVPLAIFCCLDSISFEDAIRKSLSIGGDSDTIAAISGSIAEAFWGIPKELRNKAEKFVDNAFLKTILEFEKKFGNKIIDKKPIGIKNSKEL